MIKKTLFTFFSNAWCNVVQFVGYSLEENWVLIFPTETLSKRNLETSTWSADRWTSLPPLKSPALLHPCSSSSLLEWILWRMWRNMVTLLLVLSLMRQKISEFCTFIEPGMSAACHCYDFMVVINEICRSELFVIKLWTVNILPGLVLTPGTKWHVKIVLVVHLTAVFLQTVFVLAFDCDQTQTCYRNVDNQVQQSLCCWPKHNPNP